MRSITRLNQEMSAEALTKLAMARQAMAEAGISPRARGVEKQRTALDWIYRWGWTSPSVLDSVAGGVRSSLSSRLVKKGLLKATKTESGGGLKDIPMQILTLTELGCEEVERLREDLIQYELNPYKIDQTKLRHDQLAQKATIAALNNKTIIDFKTPRELSAKSEKNMKQPDVLWILAEGMRMGIEVELSAKWERKLDEFVYSCIKALKRTQEHEPQFDFIGLMSDSRAILKRYTEAFKPGSPLVIWKKNDRGFWSQDKTVKIPEWVDGKIICEFLD